VLPPHQRLGAADLSVGKRGLQLIMQFEFAASGLLRNTVEEP